MDDEELIYERVIFSNEAGDIQYRLQVKFFYGKEWLHIRKFFLSFQEEWVPTKEGFSIPFELASASNLFSACLEILSLNESRELILEHFNELFREIYPDE